MYIYITESLCCTPEINTTLLINYTPIKKKQKQLGDRKVGVHRAQSHWSPQALGSGQSHRTGDPCDGCRYKPTLEP